MPGPQLRRIYQLASLTTPSTQLAGAYLVWDVPLGPVAGGYKTMRGTPEELVEYLIAQGLLSNYNAGPSIVKSVEYRTIAEKAASPVHLPTSSTMEELLDTSMCLGTQIYVVTDPDGYHHYEVVYDSAGPRLVWVDGNFSQSPRGRIQAKIVPAMAALKTVDLLALTTAQMQEVLALSYTDCDADPADSPAWSRPGMWFDAKTNGVNRHYYCGRGTYDPAATPGTTGAGPAWHYFNKQA